MIHGFLNVSRLESSKLLIEKQPFDLAQLVTDAIAEAKLTISTHEFRSDPPETGMVNADREKIGSVISNLISNAVKYSPRGKTVSIAVSEGDAAFVLSVRDEGMGVKPEDRDKLFERYYRVSSEHTRYISGFGVGLYLCSEIIKHHGGRIWVESEKGVGSTFYFALPK